MRNKGFFWLLTIVLITVSVYQLSFTFVTFNVEGKADKEAERKVTALMETAKQNNGVAVLPNGEEVNFNEPEAFEIAKSTFVNQILTEKATKKVYPIIGSNFQDVKNRSLAFGLDLVGGMSVTLEVSVPELVYSYARNPRDLKFKKPYDAALDEYHTKGTDFLTAFVNNFKKENGQDALIVRELNIEDLDGLDRNSSNEQVVLTLKNTIKKSMNGVEQIMERRINQFGVAQPNIQKDESSNRIYIELPGVQDEATVVSRLKSTANLQLFEIYNFEEIQALLPEASRLSMTDELKYKEIDDSIVVDSSAVLTKGSLKGLSEYLFNGGYNIVGNVEVANKPIVESMLKRQDIKRLFPSDLVFMWSDKASSSQYTNNKLSYQLYAVRVPESGKAKVGGNHVKKAYFQRNQQSNEITVNVEMTTEGSEKWAEMTRENIGRSVAITMDDIVYSAPRVNSIISGGNTEISGNFTIEEAESLSGLLNGGSLPAPCVIKNQSKVGPTIGAENSRAGLISFGISFLFIFAYMYFYYGKGGLFANVALVANVVLLIGTLASFGAVLTLAGIAGIVLTLGTAVDANILIFERIREEKRKGLSDAAAAPIGFKKAMPAIIDANMTHLLTAVVLKIFGTGEINSFATTLIIGVFTSVFSAIVITKLLTFAQIEKGRKVSFYTNGSKNLFQNFHFDWVHYRKFFYIISIAVTIAGVASLFTRGLSKSVEFTGGRTISVKLDKEADVELLRANLESVLKDEKGNAASVEVKTKSNNYNVEILTNYKLSDDGASNEVESKIKEALDKGKAKMGNYKIEETRTISNSVSQEMLNSSKISISIAIALIFIYILIRFGQWQYSLASILGLVHDVVFTLSIFSLLHGILPFNMDVNQAFVAAILTVIGYSMNDKVIVFDRIRENLAGLPVEANHKDIINKSLNTTLSRTFNTSMTLFGVCLIMFLFGGTAIKGFLFALLIGVFIGTYSSLCVSTPILIDFSSKIHVEEEKKK